MLGSSENGALGWGIGFLILLVLFFMFSGGFGGFGGRGHAQCNGGNYTPAQIAQQDAWYRQFENQAKTQCTLEKDTATLNGNLELGFRSVMQNADNNKNEIILADEKRENQNLRDRVLRLEADGDKKDILLAIERSQSATRAEIADVRNNMLPRPHVSGIGCSPCVVNPTNNGCGGSFGYLG